MMRFSYVSICRCNSLKKKKEGTDRKTTRITFFIEATLKKGLYTLLASSRGKRKMGGGEMTGRSIFFGRVCSLRLFPLFSFPRSPFRTMVPRFFLLQGKYSSRSQKSSLGRLGYTMQWPARARLWKEALQRTIVEFIGFCFMMYTPCTYL